MRLLPRLSKDQSTEKTPDLWSEHLNLHLLLFFFTPGCCLRSGRGGSCVRTEQGGNPTAAALLHQHREHHLSSTHSKHRLCHVKLWWLLTALLPLGEKHLKVLMALPSLTWDPQVPAGSGAPFQLSSPGLSPALRRDFRPLLSCLSSPVSFCSQLVGL